MKGMSSLYKPEGDGAEPMEYDLPEVGGLVIAEAIVGVLGLGLMDRASVGFLTVRMHLPKK